MSLKRLLSALAGVLAIIVASCSALKKNNPDEAVRAFLVSFQSSLEKPDMEIFKLFETPQSHEAILSAIRVLQNKESEYVLCTTTYSNASIEYNDDTVKVIIPAVFTARNVGELDGHRESTLTLLLKQKKQGLVITQLQGEEFYQDFTSLRNEVEWKGERLAGLKPRLPLYARAQALQQAYDSIVWYTTYDNKPYFYAVNGTWAPQNGQSALYVNPQEYKMGLIDDAGAVVIPVEYELIGTLGFIKPNLVEVQKDGKAGHFDLANRKLVVEPLYDMLIPYDKEGTYALTQIDTTYGWIDAQFQYHEGFPSPEAEQYMRTFQFLPKDLTLDGHHTTLCEIPNEDNAGVGIIIPPSHFARLGLFDQVIFGISSEDMPHEGWTDYITTHGSALQEITDGIRALITDISLNFTQGREEFYVSGRVAFLAANNKPLNLSEMTGHSIFSLRRISESMVEIVSHPEQYYPYESDSDEEYDIPTYRYFSLDQAGVTPVESSRKFNFTEFAKLDSSYVVGDFHRFDVETDEELPSKTLSMRTLEYMRDEILASYGYRYPDSVARRFRDYYPETDNLEEVRSKFTEIDRHNVDFLEAFMKLAGEGNAVVLQ